MNSTINKKGWQSDDEFLLLDDRHYKYIVRLDTKKGETVYIHKTKKRFYILNTIYHLYIYLFNQTTVK